jgi:GntR family transcriptional regulator / MocR family aminotransferase
VGEQAVVQLPDISVGRSNGPVGTPGTGVDLHLDVRGPRVLAGLTAALREAVRTGRLAPGAKLPSSRSLAADLGIARNTVVAAYAELVDEGLLTARQGAGTQVADRPSPATRRVPAQRAADKPLHDLRAGRPDVSAFPRAEWVRATRRAVERAPHDAFAYTPLRGRIELRRALADYLARARGVYADHERIVVCSGASHGLTLLAAVLKARQADAVAVEAYGLRAHRGLFAQAGLQTPPVALDGDGARTDLLPEAGAVLLTPAHQFPTGAALHPGRRTAAIEWARRTGGLVIEDDYDGEFRYDRKPVGALQSLGPDQVVYLGTASKAIAPGIRLGWMVVPDSLVGDVRRALGDMALSSALDQLVLAELLDSGAYDKHVRAMRVRYRRRRDQLVAMLADADGKIRISGVAAGLHALIELPPGTEAATVKNAAARHLALYGMDSFRYPGIPKDRDALVIGFGTPAPSGWAGALEALRRILPGA